LFNGDTEIEQLFKIFAFLGVPNNWKTIKGLETVAEFPQWPAIRISHAAFSKTSKEFIELCQTLVPSRENILKKLLRLSSVLGLEGMQLLESLLQIDPSKRPTINTILSHPFFNNGAKKRVEESYKEDLMPVSTVKGMWDIYIQDEQLLRPDAKYMTKQTSVNEIMRAILIDWLIDVAVHFELSQSTLHFAVSYLDRVMSHKVINKSQLQLLGVTCMKVADVFNERSKEYYKQENAKEYVFITANEYTESELLDLEKEILTLMGFKLNSPTIIHFLDLYCSLMPIDKPTRLLSQVKFFSYYI